MPVSEDWLFRPNKILVDLNPFDAGIVPDGFQAPAHAAGRTGPVDLLHDHIDDQRNGGEDANGQCSSCNRPLGAAAQAPSYQESNATSHGRLGQCYQAGGLDVI